MPEVTADPRATLKMPERSWPRDMLGNELRRGALAIIKVPEQVLICRVADVTQAGVMHGPDNEPIALQGSVTFVLTIPYQNGGGLPQVLALKEPEKQ